MTTLAVPLESPLADQMLAAGATRSGSDGVLDFAVSYFAGDIKVFPQVKRGSFDAAPSVFPALDSIARSRNFYRR